MNVTATEAKNRSGSVCAQAKSEPVFVVEDGRVDSVIVSFGQFEALRDAGNKEPAARRQRGFNRKYKAWIDEVNQDFEASGLRCDGLRMW